MTEPTFWQQLGLHLSSIVAWASGEFGSKVIAGGAGGVLRWWSQEEGRKRLSTGIIAATTGMFAAIYLTPIMIAMLAMVGIKGVPGIANGAAFLCGLAGMSFAKLFLGIIEARAANLRGDGK